LKELYLQDQNWDIPELIGERCLSLFGLSLNGLKENPDILFLELSNGNWYRCFLDSYIGFWAETISNDLPTIIDIDFDTATRFDYLKLFNLTQPEIRGISCTLDQEVFIVIDLENGSLEFREYEKEDDAICFIKYTNK